MAQTSTLLLIIVLISSTQADLPIHCLKEQIVGSWTFEKTAPYLTGDGQLTCGHMQPDNELTSFEAMEDDFESSSEVKVALDASDIATVEGERGTWTMIYDEGFEVEAADVKYFAFNKYIKKDKKTQSKCDETLVGWYNNKNTGERGCFRGSKGTKSEATENVKQDKVVQPKNAEQPKEAQPEKEQPKETQPEKEQPQKNEAQPQKEQPAKSDAYGFDADYQVDEKEVDMDAPNFFEEPEPVFSNTNGFIFAQTQSEDYLPLHKDSKEHEKIVARLNMVQKSWTAKVPENFKDMTLGEMNKRAGRRNQRPSEKKSVSFAQVSKNQDQYKHYSREDLSSLPTEYSAIDLIRSPIQQHDCGSCYALATMEMLESRIKKKFNDPILLSAQESLDCNYYNQGCDGGYGFLVSKYYTENQLVSEKCYPYRAVDGRCGNKVQKCEEEMKAKYKVGSYKYIGGAYGKSSEKQMMEEIHENGPIVVSFEPAMDFMYYSEGVYHSVDAEDWIKSGESLPEWEKVDHSVLCYGWGETQEGEKYWLIQNSWGDNWGENGRFKIRRGTDESHVESMGEAAYPIEINKASNASFLQKNKLKVNQK